VNSVPVAINLPVSRFASDSAKCSRCPTILSRSDYVTDGLGRTVERCPRCGPALLQVRRGVPVAPPLEMTREDETALRSIKDRPSRDCVECGEPFFILKNRGSQAVCSAECRKVRRDRQHIRSEVHTGRREAAA
jgi:hypothetical protein